MKILILNANPDDHHHKLDHKTIDSLAATEKFGNFHRMIFRLMNLLNITNTFWNQQLKKNNDYTKRYAQPDIHLHEY